VAGHVDLSVYPSTTPAAAALILAPGAGAGQHSGFMVAAARALADRRITVATFDFPYIVEGRKVPDRAPVLEATWRSAIDAASASTAFAGVPLFIGGKSMGGRISSQVAAQGEARIAGLVFLGYPLHPPGKLDQRRDAHLPTIEAPMLFVQGSRDPFGTADEIRALLPRLRRAHLFEVAHGDHSFKVPARIRNAAEVMAAIYDAMAAFVTVG
jgi:uncharacterized protein